MPCCTCATPAASSASTPTCSGSVDRRRPRRAVRLHPRAGLVQPPRHRLLHDRRPGRAERGRRAHGRDVSHRLGGALARRTRRIAHPARRCRRPRRRQRPWPEQEPLRQGSRRARVRGDVADARQHWGDEEHEAVIEPLDLEAAKRKYAEHRARDGRVRPGHPPDRRRAGPGAPRRADRVRRAGTGFARARPNAASANSSVSPAPRCARRSRAWCRWAWSSVAATGCTSPSTCRRWSSHHRPSFAADSRKQFVVQLFETRRVLELPIFELASERATADEREAIRRAAQEFWIGMPLNEFRSSTAGSTR